MTRVAILGGGAWGTALGASLRAGGHEIAFWTRDTGPAPLDGAEVVLSAVSAQATREVLAALAPDLAPGTPIVLTAKGLERGTLALQSEIAVETVPDLPAAILTGPSFAADLTKGLPTAVTLAAPPGIGRDLQTLFASPSLRPYLTDDITGAQIGGALKNVIAIACGTAIGAGFGESARAALMTRGFAELARIGTALGGRAETLAGLSGFGDLALTCTSVLSRNFSYGVARGEGRTPEEIARDGRTYEGAATAIAAHALAGHLGVEAPIAEVTSGLVDGSLDAAGAFEALFNRPLRRE